jgi:hypothetical protein
MLVCTNMYTFLSLLVVIFISLTTLPNVESQRRCPLTQSNKTSCEADAVCAIFEEKSTKCTSWSTYRCSRAQYRDMSTCECMNCPRGSGFSCTEENECCSSDGCKPNPASSSTPKPHALSSACPRAPQTALSMLLAVLLASMRFRGCI